MNAHAKTYQRQLLTWASDMGTGRALHKLTALAVNRITDAGMHGDGGGLLLRVLPSGSKSWMFRYSRRDMPLGPYPAVGLADARRAASEAREMLARGIDPIDARRAAATPVSVCTFQDCFDGYIEAHKAGWKNPKTAQRWTASFATHAAPRIGRKAVQDITAEDVLSVLQPIWAVKNETASTLRGSMEAVLDWASVKKLRSGPNPALWRGNLRHMLPARRKVHTVTHHAAMSWKDVPEFMDEVRARPALAARALELIIVTAARTSEVLAAPRSEIKGDMWTIPAKRMKGNREHFVPLAPQAVAIIAALPVVDGNPYLFAGQRRDRPLSNLACKMLRRRMGRDDISVHGFRSTFRDWAAECTDHPREIAEMCLSHVVGDAVERAYRRSELIAKRRALLKDWANYCHSLEVRRALSR